MKRILLLSVFILQNLVIWANTESGLEEEVSQISIFIGRFHPLVVHLPIGLVILLVVLESFSRFKKSTIPPTIMQLILCCTLVSSVVSVVLGYLLSSTGDYDVEVLSMHMYMAYVLTGLLAVALIFYNLYLKKSKKAWYHSYSATIAIAFIVLAVVGHNGGALTHGATYLTDYAPWNKKAARKKITNIQEALVFDDIIYPILEKKCISCHNASKIKGGLRMNEYDKLMIGGESGKVIIVGNAEKSEMYHLATLPAGAEKAMPPDGKVALAKEELQIIHWWITSGAVNQQTVASIKPNAEVVKILTAYFMPAAQQSALDKIKVEEIGDSKLLNLRHLGILALRLGTIDQKLQVQFLEPLQISDAQLKDLNEIKDNIVYLDLARTHITDEGIKSLASYKNLYKLSLQETAITDSAMETLVVLPNLEILNLYHTAITDKALQTLAKSKSLKKIFLWKTATSIAAQEKLRTSLPNATVYAGMDSTVVIPMDTVKK